MGLFYMINVKSKFYESGANMKKINKFNDRFLLRLVMSYSFILIIILFMGLYMYHIGIETAKDNLIKSNHSALKYAVVEIDDGFRIISSLSSQIVNNSEIQKLMKASVAKDGSFFLTALDAISYLTNLLPTQNMTFIDNFYIYLYQTDYVLSANLLESSSLYYLFSKRYEESLYPEYIDKISDPSYAGHLQSLDSFTSKGRSDLLLYMLPASVYRFGAESPASICYEINRGQFESIFSGSNLFETGFIYIEDEDRNEILRITTPSSPEFTSEEFSEIIHVNTSTITPVTIGEEEMIVTSITSKNNRWTYYLVQPSAMAFNELDDYQQTYGFIISLTLLFGGIFIIILSRKNLNPIIHIESRLKDSLVEDEIEQDMKTHDIMNSIDNYVSRLINKKVSLQQTLERQRPIIYSAYLARLMNGLIDNQAELNLIIGYLNLKTEETRFVILSVNIYLENLEFYIDDYTQGSKNSYKELLRDVFYNQFGTEILIYEADHHSFSILLYADKEPIEFMNELQSLFHRIYDELKEKYSLIIFGGVGNIYSDLMFTWQSYQQAYEALSRTRQDNIFQCYCDIKRDKYSYYYPIELEQQLVNFISSGKQKQVGEILKYVYNENFKERSLSINMIKWLLSDLRNTLLKVRFMLPSAANDDKLAIIDSDFQKKKSFDLIETLALQLSQLFEPKISMNGIIANIQLYIRDNYSSPSLCLCKISEEFNISESYFSYLFKEETKENFSDYLEKLRIEQAMILLKTTSNNIADIATEVGYNNPLSFRRAFKRIHGTTPNAIRETN